MPARLILLFTLRVDYKREIKCVFVRLFTPVNDAKPGGHHDLMEFEDTEETLNKPVYRIYDAEAVVRSAHMIPSRENITGYYFANPYIDWDMYNSLYSYLPEDKPETQPEIYSRQPNNKDNTAKNTRRKDSRIR